MCKEANSISQYIAIIAFAIWLIVFFKMFI